jgi:hypothetical protein
VPDFAQANRWRLQLQLSGVKRAARMRVTAPNSQETTMSLEDIEAAIVSLPPDELDRFRAWFANFEADDWDRQLAQDSREGKLDRLVDQARLHKRQGRCKPL